MDLSIIIINWNSAKYINKCLTSIYNSISDIQFEIIIVDNASYDKCEQIIKKNFPDVIFVQSQYSLGFSRANNLGYKYSSGGTLFFLNPDTEIIGTAINNMFDNLNSLSEAGIMGSRLVNSDFSLQSSCVLGFPNFFNQFFDFEAIKYIFPRRSLFSTKPLFKNNSKPQIVKAVSGACLMIKRIVFEKINMFSTDYFMYTEDIDLCYKVRISNYKIYFTNDTTVMHHGGGSTKSKESYEFTDVLMRESRWIFIKKYKGNINALLYRITMLISSLIRLLILYFFLYTRLFKIKKNKIQKSLSKWKNILSWSLGLEKWVKKLNLEKTN